MSPLGPLTATVQPFLPFIMTPSITACPPMFFNFRYPLQSFPYLFQNNKGRMFRMFDHVLMLKKKPLVFYSLTNDLFLWASLLVSFGWSRLCVFFLEFFYPSFSIYDLLFTCKKGVALRTDINVHFRFCRPCCEWLATCTHNSSLFINRMNLFLQEFPPQSYFDNFNRFWWFLATSDMSIREDFYKEKRIYPCLI